MKLVRIYRFKINKEENRKNFSKNKIWDEICNVITSFPAKFPKSRKISLLKVGDKV